MTKKILCSIIFPVLGVVLVQTESLSKKNKFYVYLSITLLAISTALQCKELFLKNDNYTISYEYVNIKDMAMANVQSKNNDKSVIQSLLSRDNNLVTVEETALLSNQTVEAVELPVNNNSVATIPEKRIWYLPVDIGRISQYPNYYHNAYDITSPRGTQETIHPVANGVISGIYTDSAGALIVTVLHDINGEKYTSQYVHLSSYAPGIYVGMPVTINDALGQMGTTGHSTGVHLHLAVLDCALFDPRDNNCSDLGRWYNYASYRYSQNFYGLGVLLYVPNSWEGR